MNNRLIYRVILKVLALLALLLLTGVFINSLFTASEKKRSHKSIIPRVELYIADMKQGEIRKTRWNGKEVAVLLRKDNDYFVYINAGNSGNCPLFKEPKGFKDVCTGTRFDFFGKEIGNAEQGYKLKIPPHHIVKGKLLIGIAPQ